MADAHPSHASLLALLNAGITAGELDAAADEAVRRGKGFAYALSVATGRREDAARLPGLLPTRKMPAAENFAAKDYGTGVEAI